MRRLFRSKALYLSLLSFVLLVIVLASQLNALGEQDLDAEAFISQDGLRELGWRADAKEDRIFHTQEKKEWPKHPGPVVLHVIPHSHCDPGWLMTFEDYYKSTVWRILDTVVHALEVNSSRRFNWVEVCYLERWWRDQGESQREKVRKLWRKYVLHFARLLLMRCTG